MNIDKSIKYNDIGQELIVRIQLKYDELSVFDFPASCSKCPAGFCAKSDCGRNVPFREEDYKSRPLTCKLKKINYIDLIDERSDSFPEIQITIRDINGNTTNHTFRSRQETYDWIYNKMNDETDEILLISINNICIFTSLLHEHFLTREKLLGFFA